MRRIKPACVRAVKPLAHQFVVWDRDPRYQVCRYGCGTVLGPAGTWGAPVEAIKAPPQLLFGGGTPAAERKRTVTVDEKLKQWHGVASEDEASR
jgi:hypothetical protein